MSYFVRFLVLAMFLGCGVASAQNTGPPSYVYWWNNPGWIPASAANPLPVAATVTGTTTTTATAAATPPTVAPGPNAPLVVNLSSALYVQETFAGTPVDGTHGLPVNCIVGCAGGASSNASDAVATSSTNGQTLAWLYGFNGTTWDRLQDDASKSLKVTIASGTLPAFAATPTFNLGTIGTAATAANQASQITQETATAAALGTTTDALCATPASATACTLIAIAKATLNAGNPVTTYQGTIALTAATSTTLTSGNVTMASSTVLPGTFQKLTLINVGSNAGNVCWFGGTASASAGCELLAPGASDTLFLNGFATPPTLFSTAGTTFSFRN